MTTEQFVVTFPIEQQSLLIQDKMMFVSNYATSSLIQEPQPDGTMLVTVAVGGLVCPYAVKVVT